ncbi:MAG: hypothetical protein H7066_10515 [Cytophagaceae bacterium]|nr:hypothetical protein [Gemmatimonadaceae bacterium]
MKSPEAQRIAAALVHRVGEDADAARMAEEIVATWDAIGAALSPILGHRGVAALYVRSLQVTSTVYPWLSNNPPASLGSMDLESLKAILAQQDSVTSAAAAGGALLQTFRNLLVTLVGPTLAERLLRAVWDTSLSGPPAQDPHHD